MSVQYIGDIKSTTEDAQYAQYLLKVSIKIQLFSQWPFPTFIMTSPMYWIPPSVLMIPLHCTHDILPVYWTSSRIWLENLSR